MFSAQVHQLQSADWFQPALGAGRVLLETNSTHALLAAAGPDGLVWFHPDGSAARRTSCVVDLSKLSAAEIAAANIGANSAIAWHVS